MKIKIGTRGSPLALAQTTIFQQQIQLESEIITVLTTGDRKQNAGEGILRDKKDWIIELEHNLLNNYIDIAIHSAKDVPVDIATGTKLIPILKRESPYDVLISKNQIDLHDSLVIGTSSIRRAAQIRLMNNNIKVVTLRGNINTRISKIGNELDGIILAEAGLNRLGVTDVIKHKLDINHFIPAPNQGILLAQIRAEDNKIEEQLSNLIDFNTKLTFEVERQLVNILGADCHSAVGIYSNIDNNIISLCALVYSPNDSNFVMSKQSIDVKEYQKLAAIVGEELFNLGAEKYL